LSRREAFFGRHSFRRAAIRVAKDQLNEAGELSTAVISGADNPSAAVSRG
jgi:hypothetical protein